MKFLFITTMAASPWGGSEELWFQTALHLAGQGHEVAALLYEWKANQAQRARMAAAGVKVRLHPAFPSWWYRARRKWGTPPMFDVLREGTGTPDLVVISQGENLSGYPWMKACRKGGLPYVPIVQAVAEHLWPEDAFAAEISALYQGARQSFFVSQGNRRLTETMLGCTFENAKVVANPCQVAWEADPAWPSLENGLKLACVGRLEPRAKGQDLLFEVLAASKWKERPITLSLPGSGPNEKGLKFLAHHYGLHQVDFPGYCQNIETMWADYHALLQPSRYEGLPMTLVEAMRCNRPCLVTAVGGNAEWIEEGVTGFIAPFPSVSALDSALERLWEARFQLQEMGREAGRRIRTGLPRDPVAVFAQELCHFAAIAESVSVDKNDKKGSL